MCNMARPFLKWAGGKRQLLTEIISKLPSDISTIDTYIEPFLGGGSVLFGLLEKYEFENVHVADINPELILTYDAIKYDFEGVFERLKLKKNAYPDSKEQQKKFYYEAREKWNKGVGTIPLKNRDRVERAALTIFLNKTCFNGLFRVNKSGLFNVPCNYTKSPSFPTYTEMEEIHIAIQNVNFSVNDFSFCGELAGSNTFLYFDPPYRPLSNTSGFVSYARGDFNDKNQEDLAAICKVLDGKGAKFMLSNSDPLNSEPPDPFFERLYSGFKIDRVLARRSINSDGAGRGKINEIIVRNY